MTPRLIVGIVALAVFAICGTVGSFASFEMIDKVNDKLPEEERFAFLGWYFSKYQRLWREYERLYPDGQLLLKVRRLRARAIACLLICAWGLGFF